MSTLLLRGFMVWTIGIVHTKLLIYKAFSPFFAFVDNVCVR